MALSAALSRGAAAQATQIIPPNDPVYLFVDRLVSARLVDTVVVGQRMMSRREIGRVIAAARAKFGSNSSWMGTKLREYGEEFPAEVRRAPTMASVGAEATVTDSPSRGIAPDANGAIAVDLNPLLGNRMGQHYANGFTASVSEDVSLDVSRWLVLQARTRVSETDDRGISSPRSSPLERFYARGLWKNAAVLVGRDNLFFGQGDAAGLVASLNPRAVDQVRLSSDRPFVLPWLFRFIGPLQATMLLGDPGKDQHFPHTRLFAYKVSARPHRSFEIGAALTEQVGGQGAPGGTFLQKAGDAFPLLDATILHRNFLFSNKFVGVDFRYTIPKTRGLQFFLEGAFDDFDLRRVKSVFTEDAGYVWGTSTSCFRECGPVSASLEYHVTGLRYYTHGIYKSGYTVDNQLIGDQLGPRGKGGYGSVDIDRGVASFRFDGAYEARSGNKYGTVSTTPDDADFRFILLQRNPTERRWRAMTSMRYGRPNALISYRIGLGAERVENFGHVDRAWRTNWMAQVGAEYRVLTVFHQ